MTQDDIDALFRYKKPLGFVCLTLDRQFLGCCVPMHLVSTAENHPSMLVYHREYRDCIHCRGQRMTIGAEELARYADDSGVLDYRFSDDFWCNTCQGTGWEVETSAEMCIRLDVLTIPRQLQALDEATLMAATGLPDFMLISSKRTKNSWPKDALAAEIKRRYAERETVA